MVVKNTKKNSTKASVPPGYVADPSHGPMLTYQASLPKLPVPPLSSTISKYLETVRPHLNSSEYTRTINAARNFENSALGKELQKRLEARACEEGSLYWLGAHRGLLEGEAAEGMRGKGEGWVITREKGQKTQGRMDALAHGSPLYAIKTAGCTTETGPLQITLISG